MVTSSARRGSSQCSSRKSASSAPISSPCRRRQPSRSRDRDREPVGVGVVGEQHVGVVRGRLGQREVERAGLLGVGPGDGGEVGVGLGLGGDDVRGREAGAVERREAEPQADAVQRRVGDPHVAGVGGGQRGEDGGQVVLGDVGRLAAVAERQRGRRAGARDRGRDLLVGGRGDLGAVAEVDLVAVVLRRVVARGDHHARRAAEPAHGEGEQRRRRVRRQPVGAQAGAGEHGGGLGGEALRAVARVVADHDAGVAGALDGVEQVARQARARGPHGGDVDPRRARPEPAAQPGGPEAQPVREALGELVPGLAVEQRAQLRPRLGIGIGGDPGLDPGAQAVGRGRSRHGCGRVFPHARN